MNPFKAFPLLAPVLLGSLVPWFLGSSASAATVVGDYGVSTTGYLSGTQVNTSAVSLTTAGITWGYISSTGSYLPNLATNQISTTNLTLSGTPTATTDAASKGYVDAVVAATCSGGSGSCTTAFADRPNAGIKSWAYMAMSADGTKIAAVEGANLWISQDKGITWTQRPTPFPSGASSPGWMDISMSGDGATLLATYYYQSGGIYYSRLSASYTLGAGWTTLYSYSPGTSLTAFLIKTAINYDGTKITAAFYNGILLVSTNKGASFTSRDSARSWYGVAMSSNGTYQIALNYGGYVYTSSDSGTTWTAKTAAGSRNWVNSVAISDDGTRMAAMVNGTGELYASTNGGTTWNLLPVVGRIAMSNDGTNMIVMGNSGSTTSYLTTSTDGGTTWTTLANLGEQSWRDVRISADGTKYGAASNGNYIYTTACQ